MPSGPVRALIEGSPRFAVSVPVQTTVGTSAALILSANPKRKGLMIQNTGTTVIKLTLGSTLPTQTVYHVALKVNSLADAGDGGVYIHDAWVGSVNAISSAAGGTLVITEYRTGSPDWNQADDWGLS